MASRSFTVKSNGVPGPVADAYRPAAATASTSEVERKGSWRAQAMNAPATMARTSPPVAAAATTRRVARARHSRARPNAARMGTT